MAKTEMLRIRVEPSLKSSVESIFSALGLSASEAVTLFYKQVKLNRGIPFDVKLPDTSTRKAIKKSAKHDPFRTIGLKKLADTWDNDDDAAYDNL
jgi:DNA-damage-inducible protein J